MRRLYNPDPELSGNYCVVPRHNERAVLAFKSHEFKRYFPVVAIGPPLAPCLAPFPRLSLKPLPHLPKD